MQGRVHLLDPDPRSSVLTHELPHVVAAPLGIPGLGLTLRVGLMEGLATAVERYRGDLSIHEWARALQKSMLDLMDRQYMKDDATGKIIASYAHPIFWAPFVVVGDGR